VILVPGGYGTREQTSTGPVVEFLKGLDLSGKGSVKYVLTVCTGSEMLARTGLLDGRRATTNKRAFNEVTFPTPYSPPLYPLSYGADDNQVKAKHPAVNWIAKARWVVDEHIWTSSGISAGMDLAFAWIAKVWGEEVAQYVADRSEYERNLDEGADRYAERWGAV
jgi:transcriptional regulator GlxA family with amidase domain